MKKTVKVTLEFDDQDAADRFFGYWLDGGGDGGGALDWHSDVAARACDVHDRMKLRIRGTGLDHEEV